MSKTSEAAGYRGEGPRSRSEYPRGAPGPRLVSMSVNG